MSSEALIRIPSELLEYAVATGEKKAALVWWKQLLLAFLAGAFIAFASAAANMCAFNLLGHADTYGLGRCLAGAIFPVGLILVCIAGGELFTGNVLIGMAVAGRKVRVRSLLKNWLFVYVGNYVGALFIVHMVCTSGLLFAGAGQLGGVTIKIAYSKISYSALQAFYLGIMCNWLVCLAVWMAWAAKDMTGKIFAIYFPIWLFVASGFEHCIANMYYIPAGIEAKSVAAFAAASGLSAQMLDQLSYGAFFLNNLLPVTLGNAVGGFVFVGMAYWLAYKK